MVLSSLDMTTLFRKSLLTSPYQKEVYIPSLAKRGRGDFMIYVALLLNSLLYLIEAGK
jgi:hypothetical protein